MKKTRRLISVAALLLAALMLLTACGGINYSKVDTSKYVTITEDGYGKITLAVDRMQVKEKDVDDYINKLRYTDYKTKLEGTTGTNQPGVFTKYDVIDYRTFVYDKNGNLIQHDFGVQSKTNTGADSDNSVPILEPLSLALGFGTNTGLPAEIEHALLESGVRFEGGRYAYNNVSTGKAAGLATVPVVGYITYNSKITPDGSDETNGKGDSSTKPVHFVPYMNMETQGSHDYMEAIYLGLKQVIETQNALGTPIQPSDKTSNTITINVYPVGTAIPDDAKTTATSAHINYDLDFAGSTTTPKAQKGYIKVSLKGAVTMMEEDGAAYKVTYSFPDDATGTYKSTDGTKTLNKKDAKDCTVYVYVETRQQYTCPEYNSDFILNTLKFETALTDEAAVVAAHRESIRKTLQDECDEAARHDALEALWAEAIKNATVIKKPTRNLKEYENAQIALYKYYFYDMGYKDQKTSSGAKLYDSFEEFLISMVAADTGITYKSEKEIRTHFYAEALDIAKENLLAYHLADVFELRFTEEELLAKEKADGEKWAKDAIEELREEYRTATDAELKDLKSYYGFNSADEIPDDLVTWESYADSVGGKDMLYGGYHVLAVSEKLYELNYRLDADGNEIGTLTYKDVDYKAS